MTFFVMLVILNASHSEFRSGWFVESLATQTLVIFVIRTRRVPFLRSRPSRAMIVLPIACAAIGAILPFTPLADVLGFASLPLAFFLILLGHDRHLPRARRARQGALLRGTGTARGRSPERRTAPPPAHPQTGAALHCAWRTIGLVVACRSVNPRTQAVVRSRRPRKTSARRVAAAPMPSIAHAASGRNAATGTRPM